MEPIMSTFTEAEEALAASLPGYESRPQQQAFAAAVEQALDSGGHLVAQAGCGTGKSLGYLIPAILSGKRTVVSTATKALQDQIASKDLPFLAEHLGVAFTHAVLKGRSNYLCRLKVDEAEPGEVSTLVQIRSRSAEGTYSGERDDLGFEVDDRDWRKVTTSADECPGKKECVYGETCFAEAAKTRAQEADVVVVNHALLMTDLVVKMMTDGHASMVGDYKAVVFDEAHELEEYASGVFGSQFSEATVRGLLSEVRNFTKKVPGAPEILDPLATEVLGTMTTLWTVLEPGRIRGANLAAAEEEWVGLTLALQGYAEAVATMDLDRVAPGDYEGMVSRKKRLARRAGSTAQRFTDVVAASFESLVRWVEVEKRTYRGQTTETKIIKTAPIDVSAILRGSLFGKDDAPTAVLVSATMSTGSAGDFGFITRRLGVDQYASLDVGSPFDFSKQARIYVPSHLPDPGKERQAWQSLSINEMGDLIKMSDGRALVLFTSRAQMQTAYELLSPRLPYKCLMQGQASNKALAEEFMADTHSVLFGTRSLMTGVDFQGEACSLVIIDRLPFPVPSEPTVEAKCEAIVARGGDDFKEFTIPTMSLVLSQAFGRLIRHREDIGLVAILDPRLRSKGYGKAILRGLPDAPVITTQQEVHEFFEALK